MPGEGVLAPSQRNVCLQVLGSFVVSASKRVTAVADTASSCRLRPKQLMQRCNTRAHQGRSLAPMTGQVWATAFLTSLEGADSLSNR